MMAHPLALQLRNLQSLVEIGVDKNTTVVFPAPLMTTIAELGSFLPPESRRRRRSARAPAPRRHTLSHPHHQQWNQPERNRKKTRSGKNQPERNRWAQLSHPAGPPRVPSAGRGGRPAVPVHQGESL